MFVVMLPPTCMVASVFRPVPASLEDPEVWYGPYRSVQLDLMAGWFSL